MNVPSTQPGRSYSRALEFGIYRDGDNNLDDVQSAVLGQARRVSADDRQIGFLVEDTTSRSYGAAHGLHTEEYAIEGGAPGTRTIERPHDMAKRSELAAFVAKTLDAAQAANAPQTWIDLVDHGGGDGGGLQTDSSGGGVMREDDIAGAIADGIAAHARAHPEDAGRRVDGVVANQCLMATLGFESALANTGVKFLAASPETMLAPGVPTTVAEAIADNPRDPVAMAKAIVADTMNVRFGRPHDSYAPAAAFDVFDLDPEKQAAVRQSVATLNGALAAGAKDPHIRSVIKQDARAVDGMARFTGDTMPWHADRPALELYGTFASDGRLPGAIRAAAGAASNAIAQTVLAHQEFGTYSPFGDADYGDAAGPTVHFPTTPKQFDPWAPSIRETDNAFYKAVGGRELAHALSGPVRHQEAIMA